MLEFVVEFRRCHGGTREERLFSAAGSSAVYGERPERRLLLGWTYSDDEDCNLEDSGSVVPSGPAIKSNVSTAGLWS